MTALVFVHSTGLGPFMWSPYRGLAAGVQELAPSNLGYGPQAPVPRPQRVTLQQEVEHLRAQVADHAGRCTSSRTPGAPPWRWNWRAGATCRWPRCGSTRRCSSARCCTT